MKRRPLPSSETLRGLTLLEVLLALTILAVSVQILTTSIALGSRARREAIAAQELRSHLPELMQSLQVGTARFDQSPQPLGQSRWLWSATREPLAEDQEIVRVRLLFENKADSEPIVTVRFEQLLRANQLDPGEGK